MESLWSADIPVGLAGLTHPAQSRQECRRSGVEFARQAVFCCDGFPMDYAASTDCESFGCVIMNEPELTEATDPRPPGSPGARGAAALARPWFVCLLLAAVTLAVFWPLKNSEYLYLDDPTYTTSNPYVRQGLTLDGVVWAFTTRQASNWHPLTWLSHMLDASLFGLAPAGPHVVNVLLHVANTILLFLVLRELTGTHWRSAFVAALFALHPLHVESVAWIAERKDLLSTWFLLLTLWAYGRYAGGARVQGHKSEAGGQKPEVRDFRSDLRPPAFAGATSGRPTSGSYWLVLLFFALGLMSKPMLVTLPFMLLLLDYWPLKRVSSWRSLVLEKWPFFAVSGISCLITFAAQSRALGSFVKFPMTVRLENAMVSYARYLGKMFWPADLALPYPHPGHWPFASVALATALIAGLCIVVLRLGRQLPFLITGWFWFLGTLIPVIGLIQVGTQSMADRYTYVPLIGLFILFAWGADAALKRWRVPRVTAGVAGVLIVAACATRTTGQLRYWRNSETLFRHTIAVTGNNPLALGNLGLYLYDHGRWQEAIEDYHQALRLNPSDYAAYDNLGFCYYNQGRLEEAMTNYYQALRINPNDANTLNNLGSALARQKNFARAVECYEAALQSRPDYPDAHNNLGVVLDELGKTAEAIQHYRRALRLAPDNVQAHNNLANALVGQGKVNEAIDHYRQALRLDPQFTQALNNLAWVVAGTSHYGEAVLYLEQALRLKPQDEVLHRNLANILARMGRSEEAIRQYLEAIRLEPADAEAHFGLGRLLSQRGRREEALTHLRAALRLKPDYAEAKRELQTLDAAAPE